MSEELINLDDLMAASIAVSNDGSAAAAAISEREPYLAGFVTGEIKRVAGELSLGGAPSAVVQKVATEMSALAAVVADAYQRGSFRVWAGSVAPDSPLAREGLVAKPGIPGDN